MLLIPNVVFTRYVAHLKKRGIVTASHAEYKKWLRYFLDFCDKYPAPDANSERVRLFCEKLRDKKQTGVRAGVAKSQNWNLATLLLSELHAPSQFLICFAKPRHLL